MQPPHFYHFVTEWRLAGTSPAEVRAILADPLDLPRWWPDVYLSVRPSEVEDGVFDLHTRGRLPYTLRWSMRRTSPPEEDAAAAGAGPIALQAWGDFEGSGEWTFHPAADGSSVTVRFEWRVRARKPLLRRWSWILKPVFSANHRWAMARGEESLRLELVRRRLLRSAIRPRQELHTASGIRG